MKTERMTLMISPGDKAAISARAEGLGLSVSELVRQAALDFDPEDLIVRSQIEAILPEVNDAIDRMHATFDRIEMNSANHRKEMERLQSPEYREQLQNEVWADPNIDWDWIRTIRNGALRERAVQAAAA